MRLIKESELVRGNIVGSGAFGTVYKVNILCIYLNSTNFQIYWFKLWIIKCQFNILLWNLKRIVKFVIHLRGVLKITTVQFYLKLQGAWIPEGENVRIPVAIKVLQEGTSTSQNKELLQEARVMASVEHPCCVRILAVCMAAQLMLVTQLLPLGCLLDYIRKNKCNIGSKALLNWTYQIAKVNHYINFIIDFRRCRCFTN